jgi:hypothetical protein
MQPLADYGRLLIIYEISEYSSRAQMRCVERTSAHPPARVGQDGGSSALMDMQQRAMGGLACCLLAGSCAADMLSSIDGDSRVSDIGTLVSSGHVDMLSAKICMQNLHQYGDAGVAPPLVDDAVEMRKLRKLRLSLDDTVGAEEHGMEAGGDEAAAFVSSKQLHNFFKDTSGEAEEASCLASGTYEEGGSPTAVRAPTVRNMARPILVEEALLKNYLVEKELEIRRFERAGSGVGNRSRRGVQLMPGTKAFDFTNSRHQSAILEPEIFCKGTAFWDSVSMHELNGSPLEDPSNRILMVTNMPCFIPKGVSAIDRTPCIA